VIKHIQEHFVKTGRVLTTEEGAAHVEAQLTQYVASLVPGLFEVPQFRDMFAAELAKKAPKEEPKAENKPQAPKRLQVKPTDAPKTLSNSLRGSGGTAKKMSADDRWAEILARHGVN